MRILRFLTVDPVNLSLKAKAYSTIACFCSIFFVALSTHIVGLGPQYPMIIASLGASAVILFFIPNSPLAQPWPFVGGQISSALIGVSCALNIDEIASASAVAVGGSVLVMVLLRCLHPPGAATSLAPIMAGDSVISLGYQFVLHPVAINVGFMLLLSLLINRLLMKRNYPSPLPADSNAQLPSSTITRPEYKIGISEQDMTLALKEMDVFVDMTPADLAKILTRTEMNTFKRIRGDICTADIMRREVSTVEFGTEVEEAWTMMYQQNLKALPVTDRASHVIGIITWHDFFKFLDLNPYANFQDKFRHFIRRTAKISAHKPEAVGQIMTSSVVVMPDTAHIVELIPLMSLQGHRQIPIVNADNRLVGMVYQADLISALYNVTLATHAS
ncbi:HPP family protein [methane-oxidizing endosymbiont of Gigantopelta aegis]|uniref:HPP family protein n=1 Tax=methane-oxidizing endosymbiont of Gigantopelta aegis TaxID=2794938 RepID=UPI0018DDC3CC|nr:HPP family protein [methane-oxidizing endosymbiont of Gigantopelta aegis]